MKLSGLVVALICLAVLPTDASRRKDTAVRKFGNLLQDLQKERGSRGLAEGQGGGDGAAILRDSSGVVLDRQRSSLVDEGDDAEPDAGDVSATLERMEKSLMNTKSGVAGQDSASITATIKAMQDMVRKDMMPKIIQEHKLAQAALDRLYEAFSKCSGTMRVSTKKLRAMLISRRSIAKTFKQCRKTQAVRAIKAKSCKQLLVSVKRAKKASCSTFKVIQKDPKRDGKVICSTTREDWGAYIKRVKLWSTREVTKYITYKKRCVEATGKATKRIKVCKPAITAATTSKRTCDARQDQLESTTCAIVTQASTSCSQYLPCFLAAKTALDKAMKDIKKLERGRWAQWRALKRMDCLLGHGCAATKAQIKECTKKSQVTTNITLKWQRTPKPPTQCKYPTAPPCSGRYMATYYSNLPRMAQAKTCKACPGLMGSMSLPKNFKVRCAHDPAWSYVLDYSDDRNTDDIPSTWGILEKGFSNRNAFYIGNSKLAELDIDKAEMCALSSRVNTPKGVCQWSCKRLDGHYWGHGRCRGCNSQKTNLKKIIAGLSGQMQSGNILINIDPEIARFQKPLNDIAWNCKRMKNLFTWGTGWHKNGWGISLRADHRAGNYEVGYSNNHCKYMPRLPVDTFQIRVQLKPKKYVAQPKPKPKPQPITCGCSAPNHGNEANAFACSDGKRRYCKSGETCVPTKQWPLSKVDEACKVTCRCATPMAGTAGHNKIFCDDGNTYHCSSVEKCYTKERVPKGLWNKMCRQFF